MNFGKQLILVLITMIISISSPRAETFSGASSAFRPIKDFSNSGFARLEFDFKDDSFLSGHDQISDKKDVEKALFYSVIPGFFVHGLGHLYVDRPKTFRTLLAIEAISIGGLWLLDWDNFQDMDRPDWKDMAVGSIFGVLFSTWVFDIYKSAQIANESQMVSHHALLIYPSVDNSKTRLSLRYTYRF